MAKKPKSLSTLAKARLLRKYGFDVAFGKRGKNKPQHKAAVSKKWKAVQKYVENKKQDFVFQPAKGRKLQAVARGLSSEQVTPGGFFLRKPKGARRAPRYDVAKDGTIRYSAQGPKGGRVIEEIHPIDPELLAEDPPRAIQALASKAERKKAKVILTVNGFDSSQTREYSLDALAFYIAQDLLPKFLDPNIDPAYAKLHGKQERSIDEFCDIFHVKIIKHVKPANDKKRKPRKR